MMSKNIKITPEVNMDERILYLVRMDQEELAFVENEREAQLVVDSIAAAESKRLKDDWTKVFRQDLDDGRKVVISTQVLGLIINGSITKACTIDYIPVGHAILTKGRLALTQSMISIEDSPVPLPEALVRLVKSETDGKTLEEKPVEEKQPKEVDESNNENQQKE